MRSAPDLRSDRSGRNALCTVWATTTRSVRLRSERSWIDTSVAARPSHSNAATRSSAGNDVPSSRGITVSWPSPVGIGSSSTRPSASPGASPRSDSAAGFARITAPASSSTRNPSALLASTLRRRSAPRRSSRAAVSRRTTIPWRSSACRIARARPPASIRFLERKSCAPRWIARTPIASSSTPVSTTTGNSGWAPVMRSHVARPRESGRSRSRITRSKGSTAKRARALDRRVSCVTRIVEPRHAERHVRVSAASDASSSTSKARMRVRGVAVASGFASVRGESARGSALDAGQAKSVRACRTAASSDSPGRTAVGRVPGPALGKAVRRGIVCLRVSMRQPGLRSRRRRRGPRLGRSLGLAASSRSRVLRELTPWPWMPQSARRTRTGDAEAPRLA